MIERVSRGIAMTASFFAWLYSWYEVRGVRSAFEGGRLGAAPLWLNLLLGALVLGTIGTTLAAGLRSRAWPFLSAGAGICLPLAALGAEYAALRGVLGPGAEGPGFGEVIRASMHARSPFEAALVALLSVALILAGAGAWAGASLGARLETETPEQA